MQLRTGKTTQTTNMIGLATALFFLLGLIFIAQYSGAGISNVFAQSQTEGVGVSITIGGGTPPPGGGGGGGSGGSQPGSAVFKGKAYPNAFMTLSMNGSVAATFLAEPDATFEHKLTGIQSGIYTFSISAEDTDGRNSPTLSLTINVPIGSEVTVSNLFFPPTISLQEKAEKGQPIVMEGQGFPNANIFLFIEPGSIVKEIKIQSNGKWQYSFATNGLAAGSYTVRTRAVTDAGEQSELSNTFNFEIEGLPPEEEPPGEEEPPICGRADYNCDGRVDFRDTSIIMHYWFEDSERADLNGDGFVDHVDFSILMFYWTG